ncbi:MAG: chemotaxis protein CheW [Thermosynechococcus sp. Uc]|uniref:chemotaxis protein CheW n=1 Tax=Thermosynechococcus sp. Uc TaxID=3034853 RepID=UPI0019F08751|nr:chemotaxis protein CheW [Thermosynechococcus sp. Uc]MDM7326632.1 chemotaxis protein CheW [Thermosynechococcus sp. Uc]HIK25879.1 purine-binding chemotaxis protein CheW [Thermosynechococcus sp. M46_R2017_013]
MFSSSDLLATNAPFESDNIDDLKTPEGDLHILFTIPSGDLLALPAIGVREVVAVNPDRITPVPNTSNLLLGILNLRGQVIWVADAGKFLGDDTPLNTDRSELSIIAIEDDELIVGLAVHQVRGMEWLNNDTIKPATHVSDQMAPFVRGEWVFDAEQQEIVKLLEPLAILRSARWGL